MSDEAHLTEVFRDVQRGLPRQGVGSDASTLRALSLCAGLPKHPSVLDVGCGPGRQTVALARALDGHVTAVDLHEEFLNELRAHALDTGVADRVEVVIADMRELPFAPSCFDLVWSEGAAYIMGIDAALTAWRPLLRSGGCIALSEMVWTRPGPPADVRDAVVGVYAQITDVATNLERFRAAGYGVSGGFVMPESDWWDRYYTRLEAKLPALRARYAGDEAALAIVADSEREITLRRRAAEWYGYAFFVGRKPDAR